MSVVITVPEEYSSEWATWLEKRISFQDLPLACSQHLLVAVSDFLK